MAPIDWIKNNLHPDGGIRAWADGPQYPEVSGYLIPSLLDYGEIDLANKFAGWLASIQNPDGSFYGIDGVPRTFDTAACWEGLRRVGYRSAARKAYTWLIDKMDGDRFWADGAMTEQSVYTLRINGLLDIDTKPPIRLWPNRAHYICYALEGLLYLDYRDYVAEQLEWLQIQSFDGLMPYIFYSENQWAGTDLCATAQMGYLLGLLDMDYKIYLDVLQRASNNGYPNAWTAKYHLDLENLHERQRVV